MMGGVGPLVAAVTALWVLIAWAAGVLAEPPLSPLGTIGVGLVLTNLLIVGYASTSRGHGLLPRRWGRHTTTRPRPGATGSRGQDGRLATSDVGADIGRRAVPSVEDLIVEVADDVVGSLAPLFVDHAVSLTDRHGAVLSAAELHPQPPVDDGSQARAHEVVLRNGRSQSYRMVQRPTGAGSDVSTGAWCGTVAPLRLEGAVVGTVSVSRRGEDCPERRLVEAAAELAGVRVSLAVLEARQRRTSEAELDALRAQITPHFLFNTLNTIASRVRTDPEDARQLLVRLADLFRYVARQRGQFASFSQEYAFVRTYVTLEQARFGDRLTVVYDIDPAILSVEVPVLVIQPLVENAIMHGASGKVGRTTVRLRARVDPLARCLDVVVRDDGVGMDAGTVAGIWTVPQSAREGGVGLPNIRDRLELLFGDRARFELTSAPDEGTSVHLRVPVR